MAIWILRQILRSNSCALGVRHQVNQMGSGLLTDILYSSSELNSPILLGTKPREWNIASHSAISE